VKQTRPLLVGVPEVLSLESPASWVTRAALSQGATLGEFVEFLGLGSARDLDQVWLGADLGRLVSICGLPEGSFAAAKQVMDSTQRLNPGGQRLLLWTKRGKPRYRVCPLCARLQRTPYFGIHSRYAAWCYCPEHGCLLEDSCSSCGSEIQLPWSLIRKDERAGKSAYLSQCFACAKHHGDASVVRINELVATSEFVLLQLESGRALLAALYRNCVILNGHRRSLSAIRQVEALGLPYFDCVDRVFLAELPVRPVRIDAPDRLDAFVGVITGRLVDAFHFVTRCHFHYPF
jgi:TniQ